MDTRFLESFIAVVERGSFASAARQLNLTATAVARRVRSLEVELRVPLLVRVGRTVQPTEAGSVVFEQAGSFLSGLRELRAIATADLLTGELRIGASSTSLTGLLPPALRRFIDKRPNVAIHIEAGSSCDLYQKILDGNLDAALIMQPGFPLPKVCEWTEVRREPLILIGGDTIDISDVDACLRQYPLIRYDRKSWIEQPVNRYLRDRGIQPVKQIEGATLEAVATLVDRGLGVALVPDWSPPWPEGLSLRKHVIPDLRYVRRIGVLWSRGSVHKKLIQLFVDSFRSSKNSQTLARPEKGPTTIDPQHMSKLQFGGVPAVARRRETGIGARRRIDRIQA